jgi:hypothetical protein
MFGLQQFPQGDAKYFDSRLEICRIVGRHDPLANGLDAPHRSSGAAFFQHTSLRVSDRGDCEDHSLSRSVENTSRLGYIRAKSFGGLFAPDSTIQFRHVPLSLLIVSASRAGGPLGQAAEEFAEKVESATSGAEARNQMKRLIAAVNRCATQNQNFSANCEARLWEVDYSTTEVVPSREGPHHRVRNCYNQSLRWE